MIGNHGRVLTPQQARQQAQQLTTGGDLPGARRLLEEAYAAGRHHSGPQDPAMVLLAHDLAVVAEDLGNRHEARKNYALVTRYGPDVLGADHPAVVAARAFETTATPDAPPLPAPPLPAPPLPAPPLPAPPLPAPPLPMPPASVPVSPIFASTADTKPSRGRVPWVIAATAVVLAIAMLVVVLVRPESGPDSATAVALTSPEPPRASLPAATAPPSASTPTTTAPTTISPATSSPVTSSPAKNTAVNQATKPAPKTTAPSTASPAVTRIVTPKTGTGVTRAFTVRLSASPADVAATRTRLAVTVCVDQWCFLDGPVTITGGRTADYHVVLGSAAGEGIGQHWTIRVDRLTTSAYATLAARKQAAVDAGTWGNGVSTPKDQLNSTPVSSVTVTKTS